MKDMKELDLNALEHVAGGANIEPVVDLLDPAQQAWRRHSEQLSRLRYGADPSRRVPHLCLGYPLTLTPKSVDGWMVYHV